VLRALGGILLVIGGGVLCLIPAIYLMRLGGIKGSEYPISRLVAGTGLSLVGLLARVANAPDIRLYGRKIAYYYKTIAIFALNTLIVFGVLELASRGIFQVNHLLGEAPQRNIDPREKSSYYASQDWAAQYWQEFAASRKSQYHPFVVWRRAAFKGATINIDQNGIRLTPGAE
jgi:hypothetical protein